MASGDVINYSNYKAMYPSAWRYSHTWTDSSVTIYVNASSFVIRARVSSVLFRSNWVNVTASYWNGSSFVQAYAPRNNNGYTTYAKGANSSSWSGYHNRSSEGTTSGDQHQIQLWKLVISMRGKDGSAHGYFDIWCGGLETMTESEYNNYFKGRLIKYSSGDWFQKGNTYASDAAFIAGQKPSNWRGTPISIASGTANKLCYSSVD